ncbi:MAG: metallophosphoesterase [Chitinophagaceae bacterium]|nr:metallophosphoesterase [Chitinophagaceae bacterium]
MIWITGDLHGGETASHVSSSNFSGKQGDVVLCMGDLGGVWYHDYNTNVDHRRQEDYFLESRLRQRFLWMAVDGNHENFARLFGGESPLVELFGGKAYMIREHVYYLKRGEVLSIEGKTFLAFGGAMSRDKDPGMFTNAYGKLRPWPGRTEGVNWWPEEVPNREDMESACRNLDRIGWKVDYVLTHTCPQSQRLQVRVQPSRDGGPQRYGYGPLFNIHCCRGGADLFGGIFWYDPIGEMTDPSPLVGRQIFGHTPVPYPEIGTHWVNLNAFEDDGIWIYDTEKNSLLDLSGVTR